MVCLFFSSEMSRKSAQPCRIAARAIDPQAAQDRVIETALDFCLPLVQRCNAGQFLNINEGMDRPVAAVYEHPNRQLDCREKFDLRFPVEVIKFNQAVSEGLDVRVAAQCSAVSALFRRGDTIERIDAEVRSHFRPCL